MKNRKRRHLPLLLALTAALGLAVPAGAAGGTFTDVPDSYWAYPFVEKAADEGFVSGVGSGRFDPNGTVTYAQFATMVARSFRSDVLDTSSGGGDWWLPYMEAVHSGGLLEGTQVSDRQSWDSTLVNSPISRYEMAQVMYHVMNLPGAKIKLPGSAAITQAKQSIADWGSIPKNYQDAVAACYAAGLLSGVDDKGTFGGGSDMSRGQSAVVMCRLNGVEVSQPETPPVSGDGKTLVAQPLAEDPLSPDLTPSSVKIQDLVDYCDGGLEYGDLSTSGVYQVRKFTGDGEDFSIVEAYVEELCGGSYNLELGEEYYKSYSDTFFSWGLNYTGTGNVKDTTGVTYTDTQCTINIYGTIVRDRLKVSVWIPLDMELADLGLRYGQTTQSVSLAGPSAMTGLYKLSDGSFQTSDGRLTTRMGQAVVLRDGVSYTTEASFLRNSRLSRDELWVRDFYRDETLFFCSPASRLMTGDVYTRKDLVQEMGTIGSDPNFFRSADDFDNYTWTLFFGAGHNGEFITPLITQLNQFEDLTVRVMYWDEGVEAVYYIYAAFDSSPYTVEALCAVDLSTGSAPQADETLTMYTGQSLNLTCPTEFGANYELFTWEIVEGGALAEVSGATSKTCTLTANRAGTVRLRVTYQYGVDEPDVLTGIPRNVDKSRTRDYLITIESR